MLDRRSWLTAFALVLCVGGCQCRNFDRKELEKTSPAQVNTVQLLRFSADGERLVAQTVSELRVWDVVSRTVQRKFDVGMRKQGVAGGQLVLSQNLELVYVYDGKQASVVHADGSGELWTYPFTKRTKVAGLSNDGSVLTVTAPEPNEKKGPTLQLWTKGGAAPVWEHILAHPSPFFAVDPVGWQLAFSDEKKLTMIDLSSAREAWTISLPATSNLYFSADGASLAHANTIYDAANGRERGSFTSSGRILAFPDDLFLSDSSGWFHRVSPSGEKRWTLQVRDARGANRPLLNGAVSPDGTRLVLYVEAVMTLDSYDSTTATRGPMLARAGDYAQGALIEAMAISPKNELLAVAQGNTLVLWSFDGKKKPMPLVDPALKTALGR